MKVLLLSTEMPSAAGFSGGATRMKYLYQRLIDRGHSVTVIAPVGRNRESDLAALRSGGWEIRAYRRPSSRILEVLLQTVRHPMLLVDALRLPTLGFQSRVLWMAMRPLAKAALADGCYDVVCVQHDYAAAWIADIDQTAQTILELHNVTSEYARLRATEERGAKRLYQRLEARRYERLARRWVPRFDSLIFVADEERLLLGNQISGLPHSQTTIACGADSASFATQREDSGEPIVLMTGSMHYPSNARGVQWFVEEIWPRVRAAVPEARFLAVGRDPLPELKALDGHGAVEITGTVPSTQPYFERAAVCVIPLRSGAGIKLKVGEAFAAGRAVVSTTVGASGVRAVNGRDLIIEDNAERFAEAVIKTLIDRQHRLRIAQAGHEFGLRNLEWGVLGDQFADWLEAVHAGTGDTVRPS